MYSPFIIDTHCHLSDYFEKGTLDAVLKNARDSHIEKLIAIATEPSDWMIHSKLASQYRDWIYYSIGLHPCNVDENWHDQIITIPSFFTNPVRPIAVGEIGLDYFHLPQDHQQASHLQSLQKKAFKAQLEIALQLDCPIIIHSRNAFYDSVHMIDASGVDWKKVVFHCFTEGIAEIKTLLDRGGRASFTGIITYKNAEDIRQAAMHQGLNLIMIETDAPYLTPMPHRGKMNEPAFLQYTAEFCARLFDVSYESFCAITTKNTKTFFEIPS